MPEIFEFTDAGPTTPDATEIRGYNVEAWRGKFGQGADVRSESPDGMLIDMQSIVHGLLWQAFVQLWADSFLPTATSLAAVKFHLVPFGIEQLPAAPSTVPIFFWGKNGTVVPAGTAVRAGDNGATFETDEDVELTRGDLHERYDIEDDPQSETITTELDYGGGAVASFTISVTTEDAATISAAIAAGLEADPVFAERSQLYDLGTEGGFARILFDHSNGGTQPTTSTTSVRAAFEAAGKVQATATENGPKAGAVYEVSQIQTPVTDLAGAINLVEATLGRDDETKDEMITRHFETRNSGGRANEAKIRSGMLEEGSRIEDVSLEVNETPIDLTGSGGLPPHSIRVTVLSNPIGGPYVDSQEIGELIQKYKAFGIQAVGSQSVTVQNAKGQDRVHGFNRATVKHLHLNIALEKGEGYKDAGDNESAIEEAVALFLQRGGGGYLSLGDDFERTSVSVPVLTTVPEIKGITVTASATDVGGTPGVGGEPGYTAADVVVGDGTILLAAKTRVSVTIT